MPISMPTNFVAHEPVGLVPTGTTFAAHQPATDAWSQLRDTDVFVSWGGAETVVSRALNSLSGAWCSVVRGFSNLVGALPKPVDVVDDTPFVQFQLSVYKSLQETLLYATPLSIDVDVQAIRARPLDVLQSPVLDSAEGDRRLYALAAVGKLQRLLGLNQDEVSKLVAVSRPTLWNWQQGRVPQERSLRQLHNVAAAVDLLVDSAGGEAHFDAVQVAAALGLNEELATVLSEPDGPGRVLSRLFAEGRTARRATLMPSLEDLDEISEASEPEPVVSAPLTRRPARRRTSS